MVAASPVLEEPLNTSSTEVVDVVVVVVDVVDVVVEAVDSVPLPTPNALVVEVVVESTPCVVVAAAIVVDVVVVMNPLDWPLEVEVGAGAVETVVVVCSNSAVVLVVVCVVVEAALSPLFWAVVSVAATVGVVARSLAVAVVLGREKLEDAVVVGEVDVVVDVVDDAPLNVCGRALVVEAAVEPVDDVELVVVEAVDVVVNVVEVVLCSPLKVDTCGVVVIC